MGEYFEGDDMTMNSNDTILIYLKSSKSLNYSMYK